MTPTMLRALTIRTTVALKPSSSTNLIKKCQHPPHFSPYSTSESARRILLDVEGGTVSDQAVLQSTGAKVEGTDSNLHEKIERIPTEPSLSRSTPRYSSSESADTSVRPRSAIQSRPAAPRQHLSPQDFFRKIPASSIPTLEDLNSLRPRRMNIPEVDSPEATRIVYQKTWNRAITGLDRSFNKQQLGKLLGDKPGGLNLDYKDVRMKTGKVKKWWAPKKTSAMSKQELIRLVLIMQWGMIDPEKIPAPRKSPRVEDSTFSSIASSCDDN